LLPCLVCIGCTQRHKLLGTSEKGVAAGAGDGASSVFSPTFDTVSVEPQDLPPTSLDETSTGHLFGASPASISHPLEQSTDLSAAPLQLQPTPMATVVKADMFDSAEQAALIAHANRLLSAADPHHAPLPSDGAFFTSLVPGVVLSDLLLAVDPSALDTRAICRKPAPGGEAMRMNHELLINSAAAVGAGVPHIQAKQLLDAPKHAQVALAQLWSIERHGLLSNLSLARHPELTKLAAEGESLPHLARLPAEELALRYVNHQISTYLSTHPEVVAAGRVAADYRVTNLSHDLADGVALAMVLNTVATVPLLPQAEGGDSVRSAAELLPLEQQIVPTLPLISGGEQSGGLPEDFWTRKAEARAAAVIEHAEATAGDRMFPVSPSDLATPRPRLALAFVASLIDAFSERSGAKLMELDEETAEDEREERAFKMWSASLGLDLTVTDLTEDCRSGIVLLKVLDHLVPGSVDWSRVNLRPRSVYQRLENCNYAVSVAARIGGISVVGIAGEDIACGSYKLTLAIWWQLMRKDFMQFIESLDMDAPHVLAWANLTAASAGCTRQIARFNDLSLGDGVFLLRVLQAVSPEAVSSDLVLGGSSLEERMLNAKYAVSCAHKMGCRVFASWEDIVKVRPKMVLSILAAAMALAMAKGGLSKGEVVAQVKQAASSMPRELYALAPQPGPAARHRD